MARHCHGRIVYFSMATDREAAGWLRVDTHCGRGGAAICLQETDEGELVVLRHGPRVMPLLYTHLMPATFGGRARMNVANALAAAAAAWAAGAHMHDIRQGLRTFSTSFFQAPGRLNMIEMNGYRVIIDYCHNVDGMRRLTEFVELLMAGDEPRRARARGRDRNGDGAKAREVEPPKRTGRAFGIIGIPGDRPNGDQREYGALAAGAFDRIYVREDRNLRGRKPGESAANVLAGVASAQKHGKARTEVAEPVFDELDAARRALAEARAGDLIVVCADDAAGVYQEAMALNRAPRRATAIVAPGEMAVPEG